MRLFLLAVIIALSPQPCFADEVENRYGIFTFVDKHDFAFRIIPQHQDFLFGYKDGPDQDLAFSTNSSLTFGAGLIFKSTKLSMAVPHNYDGPSEIGESSGYVFSLQTFLPRHFVHYSQAKLTSFYQIVPEAYETDGRRVYPARDDLEMTSRRLRYSFNFFPEHYSFATKYQQQAANTRVHKGTTFLELRFAQDQLAGDGSPVVPEEVRSLMEQDSDLIGFVSNQLTPMLGFGYMVREETIYASVDVYAGLNLQQVELQWADAASEKRQGTSAAYAAEVAAGIVLGHAYLSLLVNLDSYQIPLRERYFEQTKSFVRTEVGVTF